MDLLEISFPKEISKIILNNLQHWHSKFVEKH